MSGRAKRRYQADKPNKLSSLRIRLGDKVQHIESGRIGRVWEMRHGGRASVAWGDAPLRNVKLAHVLLSNLRKVTNGKT